MLNIYLTMSMVLRIFCIALGCTLARPLEAAEQNELIGSIPRKVI